MSIKYPEVLQALTVACSVTGTPLGDDALAFIEHELQSYPPQDSIDAIHRCAREVKRKMTLADILDRIPSAHPGVEEAWSICKTSMTDEGATVVRTSLMAEACGVAWPLADDKVAARLAFKEKYQELVAVAKAKNELPKWQASFGWDQHRREQPVMQALQEGKISIEYARKALPLEILEQHGLLEGQTPSPQLTHMAAQ